MGTRRRKRAIRKTRKTKGGVWTPNKNKSVKRRQNLLRYTSNSKTKSNQAFEMIRSYLESSQKNISKNIIREHDVLRAMTLYVTQTHLSDYVSKVKQAFMGLITSKTEDEIEKIRNKRHISKQAMLLANRAAMRVQQAAHIAAIGRLSNSLDARDVAGLDADAVAELKAWDEGTIRRELELTKNITDAAQIVQNKSMIGAIKTTRIQYEVTKQVVDLIQDQNLIVLWYENARRKSTQTLTNEEIKQIVVDARGVIIKKIPILKGVSYIDHVLPTITEQMYGLLLIAAKDYIDAVENEMKTDTADAVKKKKIETAKAKLQFNDDKESRMYLARLHFVILKTVASREELPALAKNPLLDTDEYNRTLKRIEELREEIRTLEAA